MKSAETIDTIRQSPDKEDSDTFICYYLYVSQKTTHYLPLPEYLTIRKSKLHGLGVFATKNIPASVELGVSHINDDRFPDGLIRTPLGGFTNYSSTPNCIFIETGDIWTLETLREIKKDEEITADYSTYDKAVLATYNS